MSRAVLLPHQTQLRLPGRHAFLQNPLNAGIEFFELVQNFILAGVEFFQK